MPLNSFAPDKSTLSGIYLSVAASNIATRFRRRGWMVRGEEGVWYSRGNHFGAGAEKVS
jgi:hypothetical protein